MIRFNQPLGFDEYQGPAEMEFWVVDLHEAGKQQEQGEQDGKNPQWGRPPGHRHDSIDEEAQKPKPL